MDLFLHAFSFHIGECLLLFPVTYFSIKKLFGISNTWWVIGVLFFISVLLTTLFDELLFALLGNGKIDSLFIAIIVSAIVSFSSKFSVRKQQS